MLIAEMQTIGNWLPDDVFSNVDGFPFIMKQSAKLTSISLNFHSIIHILTDRKNKSVRIFRMHMEMHFKSSSCHLDPPVLESEH